MLKPLSVKQFAITIEGQSYNLQSKKGGKVSRFADNYVDPVDGTQRTHLSYTQRENIVLTKLYEAETDDALLTWLKGQMDTPTPFNVSAQPISTGLKSTATGKALIYNNCQVVSYRDPEADRDGTGLAMIEIEITYDSETAQ